MGWEGWATSVGGTSSVWSRTFFYCVPRGPHVYVGRGVGEDIRVRRYGGRVYAGHYVFSGDTSYSFSCRRGLLSCGSSLLGIIEYYIGGFVIGATFRGSRVAICKGAGVALACVDRDSNYVSYTRFRRSFRGSFRASVSSSSLFVRTGVASGCDG